MRDQLNELMKLAKQLRTTLQVNNVNDQTIYVSTWIKIHTAGKTFHSISFLQGSTALDVNLYQEGEYVNNTVTINVEKLSDEELDEIVLRSKGDIITFIAKLDAESEQRRLDKIEKLKNELAQLQGDVSTN